MKEFFINATKTYPVRIQENTDGFTAFIKKLVKGEKIALITDERVNAIYGERVEKQLKNYRVTKIVLPVGETQKNAENHLKIIQTLAENGFTRADTILTLGGGVVGDLGGFVAATYMRGIAWINLPTTLLASVDACVGGKTGINLSVGKNLCGCFYQPDGVFVCTAFFSTLDERERKNGYGEIIKYALLSETLTEEDLKGEIDETLIEKCLSIKQEIVEADEKEQGKRKILNLGHTVAHAVEVLSGFTLSHGECVAKGLFAAVKISRKQLGLSDEESAKILRILQSKGHDLSLPYSLDKIIEAVQTDKKRTETGVEFVLLEKIGKPIVKRLSFSELLESLE